MSIDFPYLVLIPNLTPEDSNVLSFAGLPGTISQEPQMEVQCYSLLNKYSPTCTPSL